MVLTQFSSYTSRVSHTMGLPLHFPPTLVRPPETLQVQCCIGWPTSLTGGERPGGSSYRPKKKERLHCVIRGFKTSYLPFDMLYHVC